MAVKGHQGPILKGIVLVGGPSSGTRFRPLSLDLPKPLCPIAGVPMVHHQIQALSQMPNMKEILLIGFYDSTRFTQFIEQRQKEIGIPIKYLQEYQPLGTAGGLYHFRDAIMRNKPDYLVVLHVDICCSFPLEELLQFHLSRPAEALCSFLGTTLSSGSSPSNYGCLVSHPETHSVLHYVEKPESFVSDVINCGVYVFDLKIFDHMSELMARRVEHEIIGPGSVRTNPEILMLERDVLSSLPDALPHSKSGIFSSKPLTEEIVRHQKLFVYECASPGFFWQQIKTPSSVVTANALYLRNYQIIAPQRLASKKDDGPTIIGDVIINSEAKIHPSAVIGPNVSIGSQCVIHAGVRIRDAIILDRAQLKARCCLLNTVVGYDSIVGEWARVEGTKTDGNSTLLTANGMKLPGAAIIGDGVTIADEIIIRNCVVLPHKELRNNFFNEILM